MTQAMVDTTMLFAGKSLTVEELARRVEGALEGDGGAVISGVASIEEAEHGDIVFAENDRFLTRAAKSRASAIVAFLDAVVPDKPLIKVENPRFAFARILEMFEPCLNAPPGIHPTAVVGLNSLFGEEVSIGPNTVIGDNVRIGDHAIVMAGCFVGDHCVIGEKTVLYPNVTLYQGTMLGCRVRVHSGTVLGADGFGYTRIGDNIYKVPQIGTVEVHDDVEIGANCTVDRAKTGATIIGARTKIDNLVHVAHNVKIGCDCIIVAQVGVAGSVQIGRGVILAGQAGIKDHITIGDGATVAAQAGLFGDVPAGAHYSGYPARPHREKLRQEAAVEKLPVYVRRLRALEKANAELAARNERLEKLVEELAKKPGSRES
jgi:UDP-3-O-[3-hydroxymyristoyl] glucosamine N-acyltransferase